MSSAKESRIAQGALIIKKRLAVTEEETAARSRENPFLQYFLGHIHSQLDNGASLRDLTACWHKCLMVIHTPYNQQLEMHQQRSHRCADHIVSISHHRPHRFEP